MSILVSTIEVDNSNTDEFDSTIAESIVEDLSDLVHDMWSDWMRRVFKDKGHWNPDGTFTIDQTQIARMKEQMVKSYKDLSEPEKELDREQARLILKRLSDTLY